MGSEGAPGEAEATGEAEEMGEFVGVGEADAPGAAGEAKTEGVGVTSAYEIAAVVLTIKVAIAIRPGPLDLTLSSIHQKFLCMLDKLGIFQDLGLVPTSCHKVRERALLSPLPR